MDDLVEVVRSEHRRILEAAEEVLGSYQEGSADERARRKAVHVLVVQESRHEVAEAMYLWPVVRDVLPEYSAMRETAQMQERQARRRLHRLHKLAGEPGSGLLAAQVVREILSHVGLEESQILPSLADALSANDGARIGRMYRSTSKSAPTRPHPLVPAIPGVLSMTAPVAYRLDRVRDLLRIR